MPTTLKATLLFIFSLTIFSCRKSSNTNMAFYFDGNYDGNEKSFNNSLVASISSLDSATYYLSVVGASDAEACSIVLWSNQNNFTAGSTYSVSALGGTENNGMSYCSHLGSSAPDSNWNTTYNYGLVSQSFTCTITEITAVYVKGTFGGVLYMSSDSAVVIKTVTGGQFYARLNQE